MGTYMRIVDGPGRWQVSLGLLEPGYQVKFKVQDMGMTENAFPILVKLTGMQLRCSPDDRSRVQLFAQCDDPLLLAIECCSRCYLEIDYSLSGGEKNILKITRTE